MTQILNLLNLAPQIREYLNSLKDPSLIRYFTERRLRAIAVIKDHEAQVKQFEELKKQTAKEKISLAS